MCADALCPQEFGAVPGTAEELQAVCLSHASRALASGRSLVFLQIYAQLHSHASQSLPRLSTERKGAISQRRRQPVTHAAKAGRKIARAKPVFCTSAAFYACPNTAPLAKRHLTIYSYHMLIM